MHVSNFSMAWNLLLFFLQETFARAEAVPAEAHEANGTKES